MTENQAPDPAPDLRHIAACVYQQWLLGDIKPDLMRLLATAAAAVPANEGARALTDEQIEALPVWSKFVGLWPETRKEIARAIEAALAAIPAPEGAHRATPAGFTPEDWTRRVLRHALEAIEAGASASIVMNVEGLKDNIRALLAAPSPAEEDERATFERDMRAPDVGFTDEWFKRHHDDSYESPEMQFRWEGWQSRASRVQPKGTDPNAGLGIPPCGGPLCGRDHHPLCKQATDPSPAPAPEAASVPRPFDAVKSFADSVLAMLDERIKAVDRATHPFNDYFGDKPETIVAAKAQASELREVRTQVRILGDRVLVDLMKFRPANPSSAVQDGLRDELAAAEKSVAVYMAERNQARGRVREQRSQLDANTAVMRQALEALETCMGVPHWPSLTPAVAALRAALGESLVPVQGSES